MFGYITEIATGHIVSYFDLPEVPSNTETHTFTQCAESEKPALYEQAPSPAYSASALLDWCIDEPLQSEEFVALSSDIKMQALSFTQTFALNCNTKGAMLYRKSAALLGTLSGSPVPAAMAETVIEKAIELGAPITQES